MTHKQAILAPLSALMFTTQVMLGMEAQHTHNSTSITQPLTLVSCDRQSFSIPAESVYLSGFLQSVLPLAQAKDKSEARSLFEDFTSNKITFNEINGELLEKVALLINTIHEAIEAQRDIKNLPLEDMIKTPNGHIIAKNLQPIVNQLFMSAKLDLVVDLLRATDFLQMPECLNALASVFTAKLRSEHQISAIDAFETFLEKYQLAGNPVISQSLMKHWKLKAVGRITAEWSVADLLATNHDIKPFADPNNNGALTLDLYHKNLTSLDGLEKVPQIDQVVTLWADCNKLMEIAPDTFALLPNLRRLNLSNNQLSSLDKGLFNDLTNLQHLYLENNQLSSLDKELFNGLTNLQRLHLYNNQLSSLDKELFNGLANLQVLYLDNNQLSSLDKGLFNGLTNLQTLYLCNNQLSSLDKGLFNGLANLQSLYLDNNQLSSLDKGLFNGLANLQVLSLDNNQLSSLDKVLFNGLTNLQSLYLDNNQLSSLDKGLFNGLTNLQTLYLCNNQLSSLDKGLFNGLTNLRTLYLSNNQLSSLDKGLFSGLVNLQKLFLYDNQLTSDQLQEIRDYVAQVALYCTITE